MLLDSIAEGDVIYGVNTGFGGSANTRTTKVDDLQKTLLRSFNCGVLSPPINSHPVNHPPSDLPNGRGEQADLGHALSQALDVQDLGSINCMPVAWVRAALLIRINSLVSGYSGVRGALVQQMVQLLSNDIIPRVPTFGSISASGDLSPLSYIGSVLQGEANVTCTVGALHGNPRIVNARDALAEAGLQPHPVVAKEGLAIMNGTAMSCSVGALALHDAHGLAVLAQILTAMTVEALNGSDESFDALFAQVRPHPGQVDSARTVYGFLRGSRLINDRGSGHAGALKQDRYSTRTASQWIGPVLEDLLLAHEQILTECNSVTDNPLIEVRSDSPPRHLHGGNFQARAVTSAMDKTRQGLQSMARMMFTQCTEMINPATNFGLSPNLVADEPSESFVMKSIDITIAALLSELGFLANPVGTHVQTAEMGNQALNSLALISARYTLTAVDLTSKLAAAHLLAACQALDLRMMDKLFFGTLSVHAQHFADVWYQKLPSYSYFDDVRAGLTLDLEQAIRTKYETTTALDCEDRFNDIAKSLQPLLLSHLPPFANAYSSAWNNFDRREFAVFISEAVSDIPTWTSHTASVLHDQFHKTRTDYLRNPDSTPCLGAASSKMYNYMRKDLGVPFLTNAVLTGATSSAAKVNGAGSEAGQVKDPVPTIGDYMTRIYTAIRNGSLYVPAMECLRKAHAGVKPEDGALDVLVDAARGRGM